MQRATGMPRFARAIYEEVLEWATQAEPQAEDDRHVSQSNRLSRNSGILISEIFKQTRITTCEPTKSPTIAISSARPTYSKRGMVKQKLCHY